MAQAADPGSARRELRWRHVIWLLWLVAIAIIAWRLFTVSQAADTPPMLHATSRLLAHAGTGAVAYVSVGCLLLLAIVHAATRTRASATLWQLQMVALVAMIQCVFSGSGWATRMWGRAWNFDPVEVWSAIAIVAMIVTLLQLLRKARSPLSALHVASYQLIPLFMARLVPALAEASLHHGVYILF